MPPPEGIPDQHHELIRQLAVLEEARAELEAGWVQGSWWAVTAGEGQDHVDGVCLVGALVRAGTGRSSGTGPSAGTGRNSESSENAATGRAVDAVYDALWASHGQPAPAGLPPVPSPEVRQARVRTLTRWNDRAGRTREEVLAVVDRAISDTIMNLMTAPRSAQAEPVGASAGARTG